MAKSGTYSGTNILQSMGLTKKSLMIRSQVERETRSSI